MSYVSQMILLVCYESKGHNRLHALVDELQLQQFKREYAPLVVVLVHRLELQHYSIDILHLVLKQRMLHGLM